MSDVHKSKVFIVHGHDAAVKNEVSLLVHRAGLEPVVLHELPNQGRTIIEKFGAEAASAAYAIVVMTPDDVGGPRGGTLRQRARQNVILELGFFLGALGQSKVCALMVGDIEMPSDLHGVLYIHYDEHGAWKGKIAREWTAAKIPFNPHGVF
jgi:predicted nucleotide-binding protein